MMRNILALILILAFISSLHAATAFSYSYYKTLNGSEGTGPWDAFMRPSQVFIGTAGNIYVINMPLSSHSIMKVYNKDFTYNTTKGGWGICWANAPAANPPPGTCDIKFLEPTDIFVDKNATIYIVDMSNSIVQTFTIGSTTSDLFGVSGGVEYTFNLPQGISVDDSYNVYVADSSNDRILIFNKNGLINATINRAYNSADQNYAFKNPRGVFVAGDGKIYVTDSGNNRVQIFNANFSFFGRVGTTGSLLSDPTKTFVDSGGRIYVADTGNNRIQVYDSDLSYLATIGGTKGNGTDELDHPQGVSVDSNGYVYVADTGNNRVQIFKPVSEDILRSGAAIAIRLASNSSASAYNAIGAAQGKVDYILSANCIAPTDSMDSLNSSRTYYNLANSSLQDAISEFSAGEYEAASDSAAYARMNSTMAEGEANASIQSSDSYWNTTDHQPGLVIDSLVALNQKIGYLKNLSSAGEVLNVTADPQSISEIDSALLGAENKCRASNYIDASKAAGEVSSKVGLTLGPLERGIDFSLRSILSDSEKLVIDVKKNITEFNLNLNTSCVEDQISAAYSYLKGSDYISAIPVVLSASSQLQNISSVSSCNSTAISSDRQLVGAEINETETMLLDMTGSIRAYQQSVNLSEIDELISNATSMLSSGYLPDANRSIIMARAEILLQWASLNSTILSIGNASEAISEANASITAASTHAFLILSPNLNSAQGLLAEAVSLQYSDPQKSRMLAGNATLAAENEASRVDSLKSSMTFIVVAVLVLIMLVAIGLHRRSPKGDATGSLPALKKKEGEGGRGR